MRVLTFALGQLLTNTYICIDESTKKCIVIDPGLDGEGIYKKITDRSLILTDILLTHGHFDHALGVKALKDATGATVWVGAEDESLLYHPERNSANVFYPKDFIYPSVWADRLLKDGDEIRLGETVFRATETPGHTKGGMIFDTGEYLFTGDTLFSNGFGRTDLYGGSLSELLNSLKKIAALTGERKVCPGHGNSSTLSKEKSNIADILYNYS